MGSALAQTRYYGDGRYGGRWGQLVGQDTSIVPVGFLFGAGFFFWVCGSLYAFGVVDRGMTMVRWRRVSPPAYSPFFLGAVGGATVGVSPMWRPRATAVV